MEYVGYIGLIAVINSKIVDLYIRHSHYTYSTYYWIHLHLVYSLMPVQSFQAIHVAYW